MKWLRRKLFQRATFVFMAIAVQLVVIIAALLEFIDSFYIFYAASIVLSIAAVIWILNDASNPAYKLAWIIPILVFPIFGGLFYLFFGRIRLNKGLKMEMIASADRIGPIQTPEETLEALKAADPPAVRQSHYLSTRAQSPLWNHSFTKYLPDGEIAFEHLSEELKKAERFIFLEYFIIQEGEMWKALLDILREKAERGVDVRVMYDDFGCSGKLPSGYDRELEAMGIRCAVFNPMKPFLSSNLNHRDHRKIAVIDGSVGFTGGMNLADEYINKVERFGHWKDGAIMLKGDAVWSLTLMFLKLWSHVKGEEANHLRFKPDLSVTGSDGFVQPFGDSPLDDEPVGENVYLNLIGQAMKYLYITTPYLVIDNEMLTALSLAAKSGVDLRIITPHIPDKWYVHAVTRANYKALVDSGVRIYEYKPGFIHSKTFVVDDKYGVVGTINLDFRSLFLHFECGVWLYGTDSIAAMKEDFLLTLNECAEVTRVELDHIKLHRKAAGWLLKVFSPLL